MKIFLIIFTDINKSSCINEVLDDRSRAFQNAFLLPMEFLPRKKKAKLEKSNKSKKPSAGTSDEWLKLEKERLLKQKLQDEKKAEKKKHLRFL